MGSRRKKRPGRRFGCGRGEARNLRPDDGGAHQLHAFENPDEPLRHGGRDRRTRMLARLRGLLVLHRRGVRYLRGKGDLLMAKKKDPGLRSVKWFGREDIYGFIYRGWVKNRGVPQDQFDGRPVIGICNTWSELTPCNTHFRTLAEHVRNGVLEAGGLPQAVPVVVAR